jgi:hypothetical protein
VLVFGAPAELPRAPRFPGFILPLPMRANLCQFRASNHTLLHTKTIKLDEYMAKNNGRRNTGMFDLSSDTASKTCPSTDPHRRRVDPSRLDHAIAQAL